MNRNSAVKKKFIQYQGISHYDGGLIIFDKIVSNNKDYIWMEFSIKPTHVSRTYRVLLVYVFGYQPYVYVINPDIIAISNYREVPHLYSQKKQHLCLTYPKYNEWDTGKLIANTYVSWIALWLYFYEEWLLSDAWKGGGRHPGDKTEEERLRETSSKEKTKKNKRAKISSIDIANNIYYERKLEFQKTQKDTSPSGGAA